MRNKVLLLFYICLTGINSFSCKKDPVFNNNSIKEDLTQLPEETQEGKDTFGCLINGELWRIEKARGVTSSYSKKTFFISAIQRTDSINLALAIHVKGEFKGKAKYNLNTDFNANGTRFGMFSREINGNYCGYFTDRINTGTLEITRFDSVNFIVSGLFSFTVVKPGCDTIRITDGRFDIKYGN